ncbi:hypothetical protein ACFOWX_04090 [Sphingorhabdus arenilitoris]|uniref:Uncharacterized protein n=1 Tax=Sphingorhabdus arenilitoris TaxID=1490041 RepID=A0ABV8RE20_9SPHN
MIAKPDELPQHPACGTGGGDHLKDGDIVQLSGDGDAGALGAFGFCQTLTPIGKGAGAFKPRKDAVGRFIQKVLSDTFKPA